MARAEHAAQVVALINKASAAERRHELVNAVAQYEQAQALAAQLYTEPDSLVVAATRLMLVPQRYNLAYAPGCPAAERNRQHTALVADLLAGLDVLESRRAARTLHLPRPEEAAFETARREGLRFLQPPGYPHEAFAYMNAIWVPFLGYICALWAAIGCFAALYHGLDPALLGAAGTERCQQALISALDMIAIVRSAAASGSAPPGLCNQEISVGESVQEELARPGFRQTPFGASLAAAWERPAVSGALYNLGLPVAAAIHGARYQNEAIQAIARVEKRGGLQRCGLESCGATELHASHFKVCSRCKVAAYCSAEHAAEHWKAVHKRQCKAMAEAKEAAKAAKLATKPAE